MIRNNGVFGRRWLAIMFAAILLIVAITAGNLFAASNAAEDRDLRSPVVDRVQIEGVDPGLPAEPVHSQITEVPEIDGSGTDRVFPQGADALAEWLKQRPDEMGPFTLKRVITSDPQQVDWILYQVVHKELMTPDEADQFRSWYANRPAGVGQSEDLRFVPSEPRRSDRINDLLPGSRFDRARPEEPR